MVKDGTVRLAGGAYPHEGRIEVFLLGQWGTLCGSIHSWNLADATIICQELNYCGASAALTRASFVFGEGSGPSWFLSVGDCIGSNFNITQCAKSLEVTGGHCSQNGFNAVGVICTSKILKYYAYRQQQKYHYCCIVKCCTSY